MSKKKKYRHNISRPTHRASPPVSDGDKKTPDDVSYSSDKKTPDDEKTPGIASNSHDKKTPATWSSCPKRPFIDCPKKGRRCSTCGWNPVVEGLRIEAIKRRMEKVNGFAELFAMTRAAAMIRQTPKQHKAYRSDTYSDADTEYTDAFDDATLSPVVGMASMAGVSETATDYDDADLDDAEEDDDSWVEAQIEKLFREGFS